MESMPFLPFALAFAFLHPPLKGMDSLASQGMTDRDSAYGSRCFTAHSLRSAQKRRAFPYSGAFPPSPPPRHPNKGLGGDGAFYAARTAVSRAAEPAKTTFFAQRASHPAQSLSESEGGESAGERYAIKGGGTSRGSAPWGSPPSGGLAYRAMCAQKKPRFVAGASAFCVNGLA